VKKDGFRFEQREKESNDFFLMRVFERVLPYCKPNEAKAAAGWMLDKAYDPKSWVLTRPQKRDQK
jgi:hypothetical protein